MSLYKLILCKIRLYQLLCVRLVARINRLDDFALGRMIRHFEDRHNVTDVDKSLVLTVVLFYKSGKPFKSEVAVSPFSCGQPGETVPVDDYYIILKAKRDRIHSISQLNKKLTVMVSHFTVAMYFHTRSSFTRRAH